MFYFIYDNMSYVIYDNLSCFVYEICPALFMKKMLDITFLGKYNN